MNKLAVSLLLLLLTSLQADCNMTAQAAPSLDRQIRPEVKASTVGEPTGLRLENGILSFCDKRGGRNFDMNTHRDVALARDCSKKDEPNVACAGLNLDIDVRSPLSQPNDIVDFLGWSVPLLGRVKDCAADGKVVVIATQFRVIMIDAMTERKQDISREGGDRVAIGKGWVAWAKGSRLTAAPR